jgi:hypothetical protein
VRRVAELDVGRGGLDERLNRLIEYKAMLYVLMPVIVWIIAAMEWMGQARQLPRVP